MKHLLRYFMAWKITIFINTIILNKILHFILKFIDLTLFNALITDFKICLYKITYVYIDICKKKCITMKLIQHTHTGVILLRKYIINSDMQLKSYLYHFKKILATNRLKLEEKQIIGIRYECLY